LSILRVFRNFVDNALKYGGESLSEISIGYQGNDDSHILSVSDNGAGIRGGDYEGLFVAFRRNDTSKAVEGAGLGLAIVSEIAERHKGRVWAEPGKDQGARERPGSNIFYLGVKGSLNISFPHVGANDRVFPVRPIPLQ
jgi:K+-sensing histidine kinase KdpD